MTAVQQQDAIAAAEAAGFDLSLVDLNLELSPEDRCRQHDAALALILELQQAKCIHDAELRAITGPRDAAEN